MDRRAWCGLVLLAAGCSGSATGSREESRVTISGQVVLADVAGLNDLSRVRVDLGRGEGGVSVDESGNFEISDLEPDVYSLRVTYTGGLTTEATRSAYQALSLRVVGRAGGDVNVGQLRPVLARGTVGGRVTQGNNDPADGARVLLVTSLGERFEATVSGGRFELQDVPVGRHTISASKPGFASAQGQTQCSPDVAVIEDGAAGTAPDISLAPTAVGLAPGANETISSQGSRWMVERGRATVTVRVDSAFATRGRVWTATTGTQGGDGTIPEYTPFRDDGYVVDTPVGSTHVLLQFADACGYESPLYTLDLVRDEVAPTISLLSIHDGAAFTNTFTEKVRLLASDDTPGPLKMRITTCVVDASGTAQCQDPLSTMPWVDYAVQAQVTLASVQGSHEVQAQIQDAAGNESVVERARITVDTLPPVVSLFSVERGARVVGTRSPTVTAEVAGAAQMKVGTTAGLPGVEWQPYAVVFTVALPQGDGEHHVYGRFRDAAGNETQDASDVLVTLDTQAPLPPDVQLGQGGFTNTRIVPLTLTSTDDQLPTYRVRMWGDIVGGAQDVAYSSLGSSLTLAPGDGTKVVTFALLDVAGNESAPTAANVTLDSVAPAIRGVMVEDGARSTSASLLRVAVDVEGAATVRVVCDGVADSEVFGALAPSVNCDPGQGDGQRLVEVVARDAAGNETTAAPVGILVDRSPPTGTLSVVGARDDNGTSWVSTRVVDLVVSSDDGTGGSGVSALRAWHATDSEPTGWQLATPTLRFTLPGTDGPQGIRLRLRDAAGNISTQDIRAAFELSTHGDVTGSIVLEAASSHEGVTVTVVTPEGTFSDTTGTTGEFRLPDVPAGVHELVARKAPLYRDTRLTGISVLPRAGVNVGTVLLDRAVGTVVGNVQLEGRSDASGTVVVLTPGNYVGVTLAGGEFSIDRVPVGTYTVTATQRGYGRSQRSDVEVTDRGTTSLPPVVLPRILSSIVLVDQSPGNPFNSLFSRANTVTVEITPPNNFGKVCVAEQADFDARCLPAAGSNPAYVTFVPTDYDAFDLSPGDGIKTVSVQFLDATTGLPMERLSGETLVDTVPPTLTQVQLNGGARYINAQQQSGNVALTVLGQDDRAGLYQQAYRFEGASQRPYTAYAFSSVVPYEPLGQGDKVIHVKLRDNAGNESDDMLPEAIARITVDTLPPTGTSISVVHEATDLNGVRYVSRPQVTVAVVRGDAVSVQLSNDGQFTNSIPQDVISTSTLPWGVTSGEGVKTVSALFTDAAGNPATLVSTSTVTLDTVAPDLPAISVTSPTSLGAGNALSTTAITLRITTADSSPLASARVQFEGDIVVAGGAASTGFLAVGSGGLALSGGAFTWTGQLSSGDGAKRVDVRVRDVAGNISDAATVRFNLQSQAPANPGALIVEAPFARTTAINLQLGAVGASSMQISGALASVNGVPGNVAAFIPYAPTATAVLTSGEGTKNITVVFRNEAGVSTAPVSLSTSLDTVLPAGTLDILGPVADGATSTSLTSSTQVTLRVTGTDATSGVTHMRLGNNTTELATATWVPFASSAAWTLPSSDGGKSVVLQLRDAAGHTSSATTPITGTTSLDTGAPSAPTITITSPATLGTGNALSTTAIALRITSTDAAGSLSGGRVRVDGDISVGAGGTATTGWLAAGQGGVAFTSGDFNWPGSLSSGAGSKAVTITVRDAAGNVSPAGTVRFNLQPTAPTQGTVQLSPAPMTGTTSVTLALGAVGASQMRISGDLASVNGSAANVGALITYAATASAVLSGGNGNRNVTVVFRNDAGLDSAPITVSTLLDSSPPSGSLLVLGPVDGATSTSLTSSQQVTLQITATDGTGSGVVDMRLADTAAGLSSVAYRAVQGSAAWVLPSGDGSKQVFMQLRDRVGLESGAIGSAVTTLDTTTPSTPRFAAVPAYSSSSSVTLSLGTASTDTFSGPPRYQWRTPTLTTWTNVTLPQSPALQANAVNTFQLRALDGAGNISAEDTVTITHDNVRPATPTIVTPRIHVNATTTSVTLTGADGESSFHHYEACTIDTAATSPCGTCTPTASADSFALSLQAGMKTCIFARAVDVAGNTSASLATAFVISDLARPAPPTVAPSYSPADVSIHADAVDMFLVSPATDAPLGGPGQPWKGVAYLEVDYGTGFVPVCDSGFLDVDTWDPCDPLQRCTSPLLTCTNGAPLGLRVPLQRRADNRIVIRAVDLAGNVGDGATQIVITDRDLPSLAWQGNQANPRVAGSTLVYRDSVGGTTVLELGEDRRKSLSELPCHLNDSPFTSQAAVSQAGLLYYNGSVRLRRRSGGIVNCADTDVTLRIGGFVSSLALAGEMAAWGESVGGTTDIYVQEPGPDGVLGAGGDDVLTRAHTVAASSVDDMSAGDGAVAFKKDDGSWTVLSAGTAGFGGTVTVFNFAGHAASLGSDGEQLVVGTIYPTRLAVTSRGPDRLFGTMDDTIVNSPDYPAGYTPEWNSWKVALDRGHVASVEPPISGSTSFITEWTAGSDGVFGTSDDRFSHLLPSTLKRHGAALSQGMLFYTRGDYPSEDIASLDLSSLRWESVGTDDRILPALNGRGVLLSANSNRIYFRYPDGEETSTSRTGSPALGGASVDVNPYFHTMAVLRQHFLAANGGSGVVYLHAGPDLRFFTSDDPAATVTTLPNALGVYVGDDRALVVTSPPSPGVAVPYALSAVGGSFSGVTPVALDVTGTGACATGRLSHFGGINRQVAIWDDDSGHLCLRRSGVDGIFGTPDDGAVDKLKPGGMGGAFSSIIQAVLSGDRIAFISGQSIYVIHSGVDRTFNTSDDTRQLIPLFATPTGNGLALAGDMLVYLDALGYDGTYQVYQVDLLAGSTVQLSFTDSGKSDGYGPQPTVAVEADGHTAWVDGVFSARAIFTQTP